MAKKDSLTGPLSSPSSPESFVNMKDSTTDKRSPVSALVITTLKANINWLRDLGYEYKIANDLFVSATLTPLLAAVGLNTAFRVAQNPRLVQLNMKINPTAIGSGYITIDAAHDANPTKTLICAAIPTMTPGVFTYTAYEVTIVA